MLDSERQESENDKDTDSTEHDENLPSGSGLDYISSWDISFESIAISGENVYQATGLDIVSVCEVVASTLENKEECKKLMSLKGHQAQLWLNLLRQLLDCTLNARARFLFSRALTRLCKSAKLYPDCNVLTGLEAGRSPVAAGSFGDVYKGVLLGQAVSVKAIRIFQDPDAESTPLHAFYRESIVWSQLRHPNVLPLYGTYYFDDQRSRLCLVSPWMEHGNIVQFLRKFPDENRLLLGIRYLHKNNIIHGDLKGVNILATPERRACITDFGLSTMADTTMMNYTSFASSAKGGTARWQAPEILEGGRNSQPGDIYAFACVCYELFAGHLPFPDLRLDSAVVYRVVVKGERPTRPSSSQLDDPVWALMEDCWITDPDNRPSAESAVSRLEEIPERNRSDVAASDWDDSFPRTLRSLLRDEFLIRSLQELKSFFTEVPELVKEIPKSQTAQKLMANLNDYVTNANKFRKFFAPNDPFLQTLAAKADALREDPTTDLGKPENLEHLMRLSLYQIVIYCDDSGSMGKDNRFRNQRELVIRIARIAAKIVPDDLTGVDLRFINARGSERLDSQALERAMGAVPPNGLSKIGTNLRTKILEPLVYDAIANSTSTPTPFKRPILVCTITDGSPSGEPVETLKNEIVECKRKLEAAGYDPTSVMFLISQIGNAASATWFLDGLRQEPTIQDVLYCTVDQLDSKFRELKENERGLETWLLHTLTKPIMDTVIQGAVKRYYNIKGAEAPEIMKEIPKPQTALEFMANLNDYVTKGNKFQKFFAPNDPFLQTLAAKADALREDPTTDLGKPENLEHLTRLSLYQTVIYCDDSGSMGQDNRFRIQRELVIRIARIAARIVPDNLTGVDLRFINARGSERLDSQALERAIDAVQPIRGTKMGGTKTGTNLRKKILEPLVYDAIANSTSTITPFKRPILVCIITDGCPSKDLEPVETLKNVIVECKRKLEAAGYDPTSVTFLIGQIGDDKSATKFLDGLRQEPTIRDVLYCTVDQLDNKFRELKENERGLETWLLHTLIKPIMERHPE